MSEFPTSDADIKALRVTILRALSTAVSPKMAIGAVAASHGLTVEDVKSLVTGYGWPEKQDMRRHAFELEGKTPPPAGRPATPPPPEQPAAQGSVIERLLDAAGKSDKVRTKKLAAKIHEMLGDLRVLVITERQEREAAAAAVAEQTRLQAEVDELEKQLAQKKSQLKPTSKSRASTTPHGNAKAIRAWATAHSVACPDRGRVPGDVVEAYELAQRAAS